MLKQILNSRYFSLTLDAIGIFSLASFLVLGFFLRFIVDISPTCYFTDALIIYVECGKGIFGEFLKFYFQFFSTLIVWIAPLLGYSLVVSVMSFEIFNFFTSLFLCCILLLSILTSFRMAFKISNKLLWKRTAFSKREQFLAFMLLLLILSPTLSALSIKYYIEPPQSSGRIITINMWHNELSVPRNYLQDWSLIDIQRPAERPKGTLEYFLNPHRKESPFANLYIPAKVIDPSLPEREKISISVIPQRLEMSDEELFQKRENYLQKKIKEKYRKKIDEYKIEYPLYESAEVIKDWEIYKSATDAIGYEPDIYIHKNTEGKIENILECTPRNHCAEKRSETGWRFPKCKNETDCLNCTRVCRDKSFGTSEYFIQYSLDKKDLNNYFDLHQKILNFINAHSTAKATPDRSE